MPKTEEDQMKKLSVAEITRLVDEDMERDSYPAGFPALPPIPGARYTDERFYALELEHVLKRSWLFAGHIEDIPSPGDYLLFSKVGLSVIVIRGPDDSIRAFHNSCRHRGAALVNKPAGNLKRFVCPYHAWSYDLSGELRGVPNEYDFGCLDKSERGLVAVNVVNFRGLIFLNVDSDPQPFEDFADGIIRTFSEFPLEKLTPKGTFRIEIPCNWKALQNNFCESYHVTAVHPQTVAKWVVPHSYALHLMRGGHFTATTRKKIAVRIPNPDIPSLDHVDPVYDHHVVGVKMFPNGVSASDPSGFTWMTAWPTGPGTSVLEGVMLGYDDGDPKHEAYWQKRMDDNLMIVSEDLEVLQTIQQSFECGAFSDMICNYRERAIYWHHEEIDRRIGLNRVPPGLAVEPVLGAFVD
jgi:phenylpropionate dioxygenase-like ring-hydroxylating dioxygenase large terminal subunit